MVIVQLAIGGLGNQFYQYAFARNLACKLKTELKIDLSRIKTFNESKHRSAETPTNYRLGAFNIQENFATPEEIKLVKAKGITLRSLQEFQTLEPNLKNFKGDIFLQNYWMFGEKYFSDIINVIREEFTLKKPFSPNAEAFKQKIISAEYSVSMHFRHGDFGYNPALHRKDKPWFNITPLDYYYTCLDILKHRYSNLTVFVFSNNLQWVKENLHLDVPTEFIEGCETDDEEWILMSMCRFNIIPASSFAYSAFSLNSNPKKKMFSLRTSNADGVQKFLKELTPSKKDALLDSVYIGVPFDYDNQQKITMRPIFSLLLVVNNDVKTISDTLDSILNQNYEYYEVIIIDNASTDGSGKICQQAIAGRENVTFKKLWTKVKNAEAWNMALKMTNGGGITFPFLKAMTVSSPVPSRRYILRIF